MNLENIKKVFKVIFMVTGAIGSLWSIYRLIEIIYANIGIKKIRPAEEFENFLENITKHIKEQIKR